MNQEIAVPRHKVGAIFFGMFALWFTVMASWSLYHAELAGGIFAALMASLTGIIAVLHVIQWRRAG